MRFLVLGPLEVIGGSGEPIPIAGSKERMILADLIAHAGRVVPVDGLIDTVWGDAPPRTAEKTLGSHVSRLRGVLEPGRAAGSTSDIIATRGGGFALEVDGDEIDSVRFERLAEQGRRLLRSGPPERAADVLKEALNLWRGAAYQDYRDTRFGTIEGERLEELRRSAVEDRIDTRLATGDAAALIADLESMVRDEPLRERRWGQLMIALYRAGRQAEALHAFIRARTVLVDELGIEPGPDLGRLQAAILAHDPMLEGRWSGAASRPLSSTDVCPYKGLARFETSDAGFYFGREQLVADAVGRLVGGRFLALIGPSGSGKSSLLRAGLVSTLGSGAIPGSDRWAYALMRPGEHPLRSWSGALDRSAAESSEEGLGVDARSGATRVLLVIDQFEETFTMCTEVSERSAFLDAITGAALDPDGRVTVLLAMRADFYGRCAEHDALASLLASEQILVGPMKRDELRRAIELPAERAGLTVEDRLSDALVEDTVNQPGGLPLLSTALLELWSHRSDRNLRLDDYLRAGGVDGAVARMAEDAFGHLDREGQVAAKRILLRLAGPGDGDAAVGRSAPLAEFELERDADASRAMAALTKARLLTVSEGSVEIAHEALLRDWPRLRAWLEDDAEGRRLHGRLTGSARAWDEAGRDDGDLYRGARLTAALDWADTHDPDLNALEREFLDRSRVSSEGEAVRARRANRRTNGLLAGVAVLLALSLIVGNLALGQRDAARAAADVADARQLAADSLVEKDGIVSLLLARQAVAIDDSAPERSALLAALEREPAAIAVMHADGAPPDDLTQWIRLSPDGRVLAAGGARPTVSLFDTTTYQPIDVIDVGAATTAGDFSGDGGTLVVAAVNRTIVGIDVKTRRVRARIPTGRDVDALLFEPGDGSLITAESDHDVGSLVPRDPVTLEPRGSTTLWDGGAITAMAASNDGHWLVTTGLPPGSTKPGGHTALWDAIDLQQVSPTFHVGGNDVALSPDGRTAAIAAAKTSDHNADDSLKGHLELLDLVTGAIQKSRDGRASGRGGPPIGLTGVTFSSDGRSVISTGDDQRVVIWDPTSATVEETFDDPSRLDVFTPALAPDGATAFTIDGDGNVVAWDLRGDRGVGRSFIAGSGQTNGGPFFAISPDGRTLAVVEASPDLRHGSISLIDTSTMRPVGTLPFNRFQDRFPQALAFSPDSRTLALTSWGYVQLWDVDTRQPEGRPFRASGSDQIDFWAAAFSPDGATLATGSGLTHPGLVFLWNVATGHLLGQLPRQQNPVSDLDFSPDGRKLVVSTGFGVSGNVTVWDLDHDRLERTISPEDSGVPWSDISDDGSELVTGGSRVRLWDLATGRQIGPSFNGPQAFTVDLSPDGRTVVAAGAGAMMWDVATGTVLGRSFPGPTPEDGLAAAFTPDGRRLFIVSDTGRAWEWDTDPGTWKLRACQIAGRSLTKAEWQVYLSDRPYQPDCSS